MVAEEKKVYENLYDIMFQKIELAEAKFIPTKKSFLLALELEPQKTNLALLKDVSKEDIVQTAYVALLRRFPDDGAVKYWKQEELQTREDYNKLVMQTLVNSVERAMKGIEVYNAETVGVKTSRIYRIKEKIYPVLSLMYKIYRFLPEPIRKILKKVLRRG